MRISKSTNNQAIEPSNQESQKSESAVAKSVKAGLGSLPDSFEKAKRAVPLSSTNAQIEMPATSHGGGLPSPTPDQLKQMAQDPNVWRLKTAAKGNEKSTGGEQSSEKQLTTDEQKKVGMTDYKNIDTSRVPGEDGGFHAHDRDSRPKSDSSAYLGYRPGSGPAAPNRPTDAEVGSREDYMNSKYSSNESEAHGLGGPGKKGGLADRMDQLGLGRDYKLPTLTGDETQGRGQQSLKSMLSSQVDDEKRKQAELYKRTGTPEPPPPPPPPPAKTPTNAGGGGTLNKIKDAALTAFDFVSDVVLDKSMPPIPLAEPLKAAKTAAEVTGQAQDQWVGWKALLGGGSAGSEADGNPYRKPGVGKPDPDAPVKSELTGGEGVLPPSMRVGNVIVEIKGTGSTGGEKVNPNPEAKGVAGVVSAPNEYSLMGQPNRLEGQITGLPGGRGKFDGVYDPTEDSGQTGYSGATKTEEPGDAQTSPQSGDLSYLRPKISDNDDDK